MRMQKGRYFMLGKTRGSILIAMVLYAHPGLEAMRLERRSTSQLVVDDDPADFWRSTSSRMKLSLDEMTI